MEGFFRFRFLAFALYVDFHPHNQCFTTLVQTLVCRLAMAI